MKEIDGKMQQLLHNFDNLSRKGENYIMRNDVNERNLGVFDIIWS